MLVWVFWNIIKYGFFMVYIWLPFIFIINYYFLWYVHMWFSIICLWYGFSHLILLVLTGHSKHEETHRSMVSYSTLLSLVEHQLETKVAWLAILQTNVRLHHVLTAFLVSSGVEMKHIFYCWVVLCFFMCSFFMLIYLTDDGNQRRIPLFLGKSCVSRWRRDWSSMTKVLPLERILMWWNLPLTMCSRSPYNLEMVWCFCIIL